MRSDEEIDLMVGVRLVIILFNLWLITLGIGIGLLALLGFLDSRPEFLDLALTYGLLNVIGVIAVLKFFHMRN